MAELLERRLLHLKAKLDDLRMSYANNDRPIDIDMEIEAIEAQIRDLAGYGAQGQSFH
ncbi:MAG: hypothetical protein Q8L35_06375 [Actinomycetota bacterium]|nr:hypothetical protein [Actinomycetota bacterium]